MDIWGDYDSLRHYIISSIGKCSSLRWFKAIGFGGMAPSPCLVQQTKFGGCYIIGILSPLVTMDQHNTTFVARGMWLVLWLKGFTMDVILDSRCMSQVMKHADQPPLAIVKKVNQPWTTLPMNMNFPSSHVFHDDGPRTWFWIQNIYIRWNLILMNKNMLWGSIPTLPKFLVYKKSSNVKSLVKSWTWFHLHYELRFG